MINLETYGWNDKLSGIKQKSVYKDLSHGRVTAVNRTCYEVISENGALLCELTGNMMYGKSDYELPCVGDWVIFQPLDENKGIIVDMLTRERTLFRKKSGTVADRQAIASYVDKAFIVQGLDDNFNVRRAERFMVQITESDIKPVLVLNKADLDFDKQKVEEQVKHLGSRMPIIFTSTQDAESISRLREHIKEGETVIFVGSSGVGKSSLINALCNDSIFQTSHISQSTGKGRHTSTRREMVLMQGSGILIDTPGVREFGLTIDDTESIDNMLDISDFAGSCRFKDCKHINEPGCAVLEAVNNGTLDRKVYESYLKLKREAWYFSTSEYEKRKKDKSFSKLVDEFKKHKGDF